jgi:hypothetical protein
MLFPASGVPASPWEKAEAVVVAVAAVVSATVEVT